MDAVEVELRIPGIVPRHARQDDGVEVDGHPAEEGGRVEFGIVTVLPVREHPTALQLREWLPHAVKGRTRVVADDGDLEQMGDLALIGKATPIGASQEIIVGPMRGRSRAYRVEGNRYTALSLAFNQRCDMVAATALVGPGAPASIEPAVLAFLNSDRMLKWAEIALGL